jgi:hypothetical protein
VTAFPFAAHVALLDEALARREAIVERVEQRLLNVKGKDVSRHRDRQRLDAAFAACVFDGLSRSLAALNGTLAAARHADGFEPLFRHSSSHELQAADLLIRAYDHWERHRWPGASARRVYADRLYAAFMLHQLEDLSLRIWDAEGDGPDAALRTIQRLLDALNGPGASIVLLRDARWLLQTAQGPLTKRLEPYFTLAGKIARSFTDADRLEIHKAGARLAGGHLRSQLRHRMAELGRAAEDPLVLAMTRNSNAMDLALLIRDLLPLLQAYKDASADGPIETRLDLADAIVQGCSADPELLLTRLDLLEPYTMIEDVFVRVEGNGRAAWTDAGEVHRGALASYARLIDEVAADLIQDARRFDPAERTYSPLAMIYGFCADLLSNMAADVLDGASGAGANLEEMFASSSIESARCELSMEWACQVFERTRAALEARAAKKGLANASPIPGARLFVVADDMSPQDLPGGSLPEPIVSAQEHCITSDVQRALSSAATAFPRSQFVTDRGEGRFLASAESDGRWYGISKAVLTACTSQGQNAVLTDVPRGVCEVLRLTCRHLAAFPPPG